MIPHETNRGDFHIICQTSANKINNGNEKVFYRSSGYGIFGRMWQETKPKKDVPVEVEREFAIMSAAPGPPSLPLIHSVKATQPAKPVNMRGFP